MSRHFRLALAAILGALAAANAVAAFEVRILRPLSNQAVFGPTELLFETRGGIPQQVEIYYNDTRVGALNSPPWKFVVDVGGENVDRHFHLVAFSAAGERASTELMLPRVQVDEVLELALRQLYVTATRGTSLARDLDREDFRIFDGGERQDVVTFERGDAPLAALLLIDSSLSMRGAPLRAALAGAHAFASGMKELDEARLLLFSDRVVRNSPFTSDAALLVSDVSETTASGGSAINDHLFLALELLEARQGRRVIILLSDGVDIESLLPASEVLELSRRSQAMVYWIRVANEPIGMLHRSSWRDLREHAEEIEHLDELVKASGGRRVEIPSFDEAPAAFTTILNELRQQYVLGYYPKHRRGNGSWRAIELRSAASGVKLRARDGYFDD